MTACDDVFFDADGNPEPCLSAHKEEPDCFECSDRGCIACWPHASDCGCGCRTPITLPVTSPHSTEGDPF